MSIAACDIASEARPSARQLAWQNNEFYGLVSYGMPVFTGKQYGDGFTPASVFWPENMDTDSWCDTAKKAGMKGIVLTCKHYDGFCLWPTKATEYSVKSSNWKDGEGDLVRLVADSCRKYGLKFGIYLAPWDRHESTYGSGKAYDDFFCQLLTELLTDYGDVFCVWLDAVCGADENTVQNYDWARYYGIIRTLMPNAVISFRGPDVRWLGNERGVTRAEEWSSVPSWHGVDDNGFSPPSPAKKSSAVFELDIGSRKAIKNEESFIWYPCEVSVPMRSHWFYNEDDKYSIKTKDKLLKLYYSSVGNNAAFMLGLSPNKRGELDETDTQILSAFGYDLKVMFGFNLLEKNAKITASSSYNDSCTAHKIVSSESDCYWRPADSDKKPELIIELSAAEDENDILFDRIVLSENIENGQRIEEFEIFVLNAKGKWKSVYEGTAIGYKHICCLPATKSEKVKVVFSKFRGHMELLNLRIN